MTDHHSGVFKIIQQQKSANDGLMTHTFNSVVYRYTGSLYEQLLQCKYLKEIFSHWLAKKFASLSYPQNWGGGNPSTCSIGYTEVLSDPALRVHSWVAALSCHGFHADRLGHGGYKSRVGDIKKPDQFQVIPDKGRWSQ